MGSFKNLKTNFNNLLEWHIQNEKFPKLEEIKEERIMQSQNTLAKCSNCGAFHKYHNACPECGYYEEDKLLV